MSGKGKDKEREEAMMAKLGLIAPLLNGGLDRSARIAMQKEIAERSGLSYRTIGRYVEKMRAEGPEAFRKEGRTREDERKIPEEVVDEAVRLRKEFPQRSVNEIIYILENSDRVKVERGSIKRSTLQLRLAERGFTRRQMSMYSKPESGKAATRFSKAHRMDLLQGDAKFGPYLPIGDRGEMVQTVFLCWIDDCTRYIVHGRFYASNKAVDVKDSLLQAVLVYGVPECVYTDNGRQYTSKALSSMCTILGIRLKHAKPYSPQSKGKVERFNSTLDSFISEMCIEVGSGNVTTLRQLNDHYLAWQETIYHERCQEALGGISPRAAFKLDTKPLRLVDGDLLRLAAMDTGERKVAKDGTVSIDGDTYLLDDLSLIGFTVAYSRQSDAPDDITIHRKGFKPSKARRLSVGEDVDYEARNRSVREEKVLPRPDKSEYIRAVAADYTRSHPGTDLELGLPGKEADKRALIGFAGKEVGDD